MPARWPGCALALALLLLGARAKAAPACEWTASRGATDPHGAMNDAADEAHANVLGGGGGGPDALVDAEPSCQLDDAWARELLGAGGGVAHELYVARVRQDRTCSPHSEHGAEDCLNAGKEPDGTPTCVFDRKTHTCTLSPLISMRAMGWKPRQEAVADDAASTEEFGHGVFLQKVIRCNLLSSSLAVCNSDGEHCEWDIFTASCVPRREAVSDVVEAIGAGAAAGLLGFAKSAAQCQWAISEDACESVGHCLWAGLMDGGCQVDMAAVMSQALGANAATAPLVELDALDRGCEEAGLFGGEEACVKQPQCMWEDPLPDGYYAEAYYDNPSYAQFASATGGCYVDGAEVARTVFLRESETPLFSLFDDADDCADFRYPDTCGAADGKCTWHSESAIKSGEPVVVGGITVKRPNDGGFCVVADDDVRRKVQAAAPDEPCEDAWRAIVQVLQQSARCALASSKQECKAMERPMEDASKLCAPPRLELAVEATDADGEGVSAWEKEEMEAEGAFAMAKSAGGGSAEEEQMPLREDDYDDYDDDASTIAAAAAAGDGERQPAASPPHHTYRTLLYATMAGIALVALVGAGIAVRHRRFRRTRADEWANAALI